jgi:hypothetical protein
MPQMVPHGPGAASWMLVRVVQISCSAFPGTMRCDVPMDVHVWSERAPEQSRGGELNLARRHSSSPVENPSPLSSSPIVHTPCYSACLPIRSFWLTPICIRVLWYIVVLPPLHPRHSLGCNSILPAPTQNDSQPSTLLASLLSILLGLNEGSLGINHTTGLTQLFKGSLGYLIFFFLALYSNQTWCGWSHRL